MQSLPNYRPADRATGPAFSGVRTFMRLPHVTDISGVNLAVVGVPFDTGASFGVGCRFGPEAVRSASVLLRPYHSEHDLDIFSYLSAVDFGDISVVPGFIEESQHLITEALSRLHNANIIPISIGGDHSIALPELQAVASAHGPVALILFDSHPDTYESFRGHPYFHSTPFRRAVEEGLIDPSCSIICGLRGSTFGASDWMDPVELGFSVLRASTMHGMSMAEAARLIRERVAGRPSFLSFDIDFLDPAYAPGTGTPEVGGFSTWEAQELLRGLDPVRIVGADVVEVLPSLDVGRVTALGAATIIHEIISLVALERRRAERGNGE